MALVSAPIAVAAATATTFDLPAKRSKVAVAVVFYSTADAEDGDEVAAGSGTRDIAVSIVSPGNDGVLTMPVTGASVEDQPARAYKVFDLGVEVGRISIACAQATDPGTATHYRIWVEA